MTMKEVGEVLSVGESRVSQLHSSALARLRECLVAAAEAPQPQSGHEAPPRALALPFQPLA